MAFHGFSLIGFPIKYETELPFKLSKTLTIAKPTEFQLKRIRKYLKGLSGHYEYEVPFERQIIKKREKDIGGQEVYFIDTNPLKKKDWLYSVVKFKSEEWTEEYVSIYLLILKIASSLLDEKKFILIHSFHNRAYTTWGSTIEAIDHLSLLCLEEQNHVWNESDLITLQTLYNQVSNIYANFPDLAHSLNLFISLPRINGYNELICLGLFSIIESVLTHSPKTDSDSIGHQIKTKVRLLSNRFDKEIDYSSFKNIPVDTLWKKLYDFRSRIAHGGKIDFTKEFKVLEDSYTVQLFLLNFLKTLLRNALTEPQLYIDLKLC